MTDRAPAGRERGGDREQKKKKKEQQFLPWGVTPLIWPPTGAFTDLSLSVK